jgi:hypothetical protein
MQAAPRIAFCLTCKGRSQHLKLTLPKNLVDNADYRDAVFVIVDYGSQDDLLEYLATQHAADIERGRIAVYSLQRAGAFNMAHAKNVAHRCGIMEGADVLVNLDADNYTGVGFATYLAAQFAIYGSRSFYAIGKTIPGVTPRGVSGRIAVSKDAFLNAGGYDEKFDTWSADDKDFNFRLRRLGYDWHRIEDQYLECVRHNDKTRFREYKHAQSSLHSGEEEIAQSQTTIANFGRFGMGSLFRNWSLGPIVLNPLPTRIFGIGMHKTGTTSLHHALTMLHFESAHWPSAHWAKAIWKEMRETGRSSTVEKHYAACDLPITFLYRELDKAYPGSKFILTLRNEATWLESIRKHWDRDLNPFRKHWDTDPFTHRAHLELYGRRQFDADIFLARYRRHNQEVVDYFQHRPNDLLVLDLDADVRWHTLCDFLDKPIPRLAYPKANGSPAT